MKTFTGAVYEAKAVILCTGTYLKARCLCGKAITYTGQNGLQAANHLTDSLESLTWKCAGLRRGRRRGWDCSRAGKQ